MIAALTRILGREPTEAEKKNFEANFAAAFSEPLPKQELAPFNPMTGSYETISDQFGE
jgi:hypothetical protein